MKCALFVFVGIIQSSFISTCSLIPRQPVLTVPIRFEEGFAFTRSFTVPASARYMLLLEFHKGTPRAVRLGAAPEDFAAKFSISSFRMTLGTGTSDSTPREGTFKPNYTAATLLFSMHRLARSTSCHSALSEQIPFCFLQTRS